MSAPLIFVVAGESSGDILGGRLMAALKELTGGEVRFEGIGGPRMEAEGLSSRFPMSELSIMGLAEILPHIPRLLRRIDETVATVQALRPAALVTIDSPGFSFRVAQKLKGQGIKLIHYGAPTVWAWKPGRARKIVRFLDHLLALLPFEPPYFHIVGLPCDFVGHPVVDSGADRGDGPKFRARLGLSPGQPLLCVLPGSRMGEVTRLLPIFRDTVGRLVSRFRDLQVVVPTVPHVAAAVRDGTLGWVAPVTVVETEADKFDAFAASQAALAASGTVALELAMAGTPNVIAYRLNPLTAWLGRKLIRVPFVSLVNILLGRPVVPELLQDDCRPETLSAAITQLLDDGDARHRQQDAFREATLLLGRGGESPSRRAAEAVLNVIGGQS